MRTDGAVDRILATVVPDRTVERVDPVGRGNRKDTAVARFADGPPLVVQRSADAGAIRTEARLHRAIGARTAVPVPDVVAVGACEGVTYCLVEHVGGAPLHERFAALPGPDRRRIVERFGAWLATLHETFRFEGYGPLRVGGDAVGDGDGAGPVWSERGPPSAGLVAEVTDWPVWFDRYAHATLDRLPEAFDDLQASLRACLADASHERSPPGRLFPWDFRPGNALVEDGAVRAVLDWEAPLAAPPALSVAKAEYLVADWYVDDPAPLRAAFRAGYRRRRPVPEPTAAHRVAAIADSAVDSRGVVTNTGYPELDRESSVRAHRRALERALAE